LRQQVRDGSQNALGTAVELGARAAASDGQDARRVTGSLLESDGSGTTDCIEPELAGANGGDHSHGTQKT
jgi:hypothetical protein